MSPVRNILVVQPKRIGDLILTAPAVAELRRVFPGAHITLLAAGASCGIAPLIGADESLSYRFRRPNLALWPQLATTKFDLAIDFGGTDRSSLLVRVSRAPVRVTFEKSVAGKHRARAFTHLGKASVRDLHTVDLHLALIDEAARALCQNPPASLPKPDTALHLPDSLSASVRERIRTLTGASDARYAIVHPGTARPEKYWLPDRWAEVIRHLSSLGLTPIITGSNDSSERGHLARIHESLREKSPPESESPASQVVDLAGQITLGELAALIEKSEIAVGVDSAAMHLAAAFRRPQVVLFGPTNPYHWRPRHPAAAVFIASSPNAPTTEFAPRHQKAQMSKILADAINRSIDHLMKA